jgi:sugar O-acyltransferase (sialic acid O-acetyltransferase NeuD family)
MKHLAILGASGHGKVIAETALLSGEWLEISFFDDAWPECHVNGQWQVVGDTETLLKSHSSFQGTVIGIGNNKIRQDKQQLLVDKGATLVSVIHPEAFLSSDIEVGAGTVVFAKAVINIDSTIGEGCIINTSATVDHDCHLANFSHVCPGTNLAGDVKIGTRTWVGIGASIIQGVTVGNDVMIGAGAVVIENISATKTVVGVPARSI